MMKLSANLSDNRYSWCYCSLKELLPKSPSSIVSDIGAGGASMRSPTEAIGAKWQGFDFQPQNSEICHWNLNFPAPDGFSQAGVILLLDVLEHLDNPCVGIQNLTDSLLPGGYLILTVPNPRWSRSRFSVLGTGYPACFTQSDLDLNHHVFTPWPHIVERLLLNKGFTIEKYVTLDGSTSFPSKPYNWRYPMRLAFALLNFLLEQYDRTACGMSYGIIARKTK